MVSEDIIVRPCGPSWAYCDGNCAECCNNNLTYSTSTEVADEKYYI